MSQHTGAFTIELDTGRLAAELADEVADRVLTRLRSAARDATGDATRSYWQGYAAGWGERGATGQPPAPAEPEQGDDRPQRLSPRPGEVYERPAEPDPEPGPRRGVAGFGDVTDDGLSDQDEPS